MRRLGGTLLTVLLLMVVSACTTVTVPFAATELVPTTTRGAAELCNGQWTSGGGSLMIRQSALFEFEGLRVPIAGVMKLDRSAKVARLVGMNDMGVKLYDISIAAASSQAHFIVPDLARYPGFAEAVAVSVRRIFLDPAPVASDTFEQTATKYLFTRQGGDGGTIRFALGGAEAQLLEKSYSGPSGAWRIGYYQYQQQQGQLFPGGIVLDDQRAGYRLTLWLESVDKSDE